MNETHGGRRAPGLLAGLALAWLAATLWSAHATLSGYAGDDLLSLNAAALALPVVINAALVAGVALGLVAARTLGVGRAPGARLAIGAGAGLVLGLAVAGVILAGYGTRSSLVVIAVAVAVVGLLGGTLGGLPQGAIVGAAVAGVLTWFLLGFLQGAFNDQLLSLFGAGRSASSRVDATSRLLLTVAVIGATLAGLVAYRYLRRQTGTPLPWPAYLAAGTGPGLLLLLANLVALAGGAKLSALATASNAADRLALEVVRTAGVNTSLVVLFIGGIAAVIAFGRTLGRPADDGSAAEGPQADGPASAESAVESAPHGAVGVEAAPDGAAPAPDGAVGADGLAEAGQTS